MLKLTSLLFLAVTAYAAITGGSNENSRDDSQQYASPCGGYYTGDNQAGKDPKVPTADQILEEYKKSLDASNEPNELKETRTKEFERVLQKIWPPNPDFIYVDFYSDDSFTPVRYNLSTNELPSGFDPAKPTKIYIHGAYQGGFYEGDPIVRGYQTMKGNNVFVLDWGYYSKTPMLSVLKSIGFHTGRNLYSSLVTSGANSQNIQVIAFGKGIVIATHGSWGVDKPIGRLTALNTNALSKMDIVPCNNFDFVYTVNLEKKEDTVLKSQVDFLIAEMAPFPKTEDCRPLTSSLLLTHLWAESITTPKEKGFYGIKCDSVLEYMRGNCRFDNEIIMSDCTSRDARGQYVVPIAYYYPYALGKQYPMYPPNGVPFSARI